MGDILQSAAALPLAHVLFVEDDPEIRGPVADFLQQNGLRVSVAQDGEAMDLLLSEYCVDLLVLDVMLPKEDGLSLCRRVRAAGSLPVIMLTARGSEIDRIVGLEMGADDYLTKSFSSMAVANHHPVTALFDVPASEEMGPSLLEVVSNGIASEPIEVLVE